MTGWLVMVTTHLPNVGCMIFYLDILTNKREISSRFEDPGTQWALASFVLLSNQFWPNWSFI